MGSKNYTLVAKRTIETTDEEGNRKTIRANGRFRLTDKDEAKRLVKKGAAVWAETPASEDGLGNVKASATPSDFEDNDEDEDGDDADDSDDEDEDEDDGLGGNKPVVKKAAKKAAKKAGKKNK